MPRRAAQLLIIALAVAAALAFFSPAGTAFAMDKLTLLVTSDMEGQMEPRAVKAADGRTMELGGMARLAAAIKGIRAEVDHPVLATTAGDDLQGPYYLTFKGRAIYAALKEVGFDAGTLGNHEFDLGPGVLAQALELAPFPIVSSNLTAPTGSPLKGKFKNRVIIDTGKIKVGFLGLMTPDLPMISSPGDSVFMAPDLAEAAQEAVDGLKEDGARIIVCLSHLGLDRDRLMAGLVAGIDVIAGGHTHILIPSGSQVYVDRENDGKTVIVQAGNRTTHLGRLDLNLTGNRVISAKWTLIPLDEAVGSDPATAEIVAGFRAQMPPVKPLAQLNAPLDCRGRMVRSREMAVGNLIAGILRQAGKADIALLNGGNIRTDRILPAGKLTNSDITDMLPFGNKLAVLSLPGEVLLRALEWGLDGLSEYSGRFLQISGLRYKAIDGWVVEADVQAPNGGWQPLEIDRIYKVAMTTYLAKGGDGFAMLPREAENRVDLNITLAGAVTKALAYRGQITPRTDGRIELEKDEEDTPI